MASPPAGGLSALLWRGNAQKVEGQNGSRCAVEERSKRAMGS